MLRTRLLATTFLIVIGSVSFSPAHSAGIFGDNSNGIATAAAGTGENGTATFPTRTQRGIPGNDRNRKFLCTYGYKVYDADYDSGQGSGLEQSSHYAVPITGKGASVSEIQVTDSEPASSYSPKFKAGIYADKNGTPGRLIAGGSGKAQGSCRLTTVVIPKTFLTAGKKYWVEENAPDPGYSRCCHYYAVNWGYRSGAKQNALYQYYNSLSQESSWFSDWLPVSGPAPFVKVK